MNYTVHYGPKYSGKSLYIIEAIKNDIKRKCIIPDRMIDWYIKQGIQPSQIITTTEMKILSGYYKHPFDTIWQGGVPF